MREALLQPFFLAPDRFGIIAAPDADAKRIGEFRTGRKQISAALVDIGVLLVPENVAAFGVEEHDALRQDVERFAQARIGLLSICNGGFGFAASERERGRAVVYYWHGIFGSLA